MKDLEKLKKVFGEVGIKYTVRTNDEYSYLFFGERRNIYFMTNGEFNSFEESNLDNLINSSHKMLEFENGKLASYFNS